MFCKSFSTIVEPLTVILHKEREVSVARQMQVAFEKVKTMLMHKPIPYALNFEKPFRVTLFAKDVEAGAVLAQKDDLALNILFAIAAKKFEISQMNYCIKEKRQMKPCVCTTPPQSRDCRIYQSTMEQQYQAR